MVNDDNLCDKCLLSDNGGFRTTSVLKTHFSHTRHIRLLQLPSIKIQLHTIEAASEIATGKSAAPEFLSVYPGRHAPSSAVLGKSEWERARIRSERSAGPE